MSGVDVPCVAISSGDPAGIGPEVTLKALADPDVARLARWIVVGDAWILQPVARDIGLPPLQPVVSAPAALPDEAPLTVLDCRAIDPADYVAGRASAACGRAALAYVRAAVQLCLEGRAHALATGPVHKEAVTMAGIPFTGHTEYIAEMCGVEEPRMLLVNDHLRVVHVSTHVGLRAACDLDPDRVLHTIRLGARALRAMGIAAPRLAVCGLNPHAGENGLFGEEDRARIAPAVRLAREEGIDCQGPLPADTVFLKAVRGAYDLVVAMYHDQGHIPAKLLDFERTVNVSLGLPIFRTSVDHGTAFDIVGRNAADPGSMRAALHLAASLARGRAPLL